MPESRVWSGDNLDYPGIHPSERIIREIRKPNGDKITIFDSGSTVIHKEAFRLTYPRPIEHHTGRTEDPGTALPGSKFAQILEEIRQELTVVVMAIRNDP